MLKFTSAALLAICVSPQAVFACNSQPSIASADCYFAGRQWAKVVAVFTGIPSGALMSASPANLARLYYEVADSYHNLGQTSRAALFIGEASSYADSASDAPNALRQQIALAKSSWPGMDSPEVRAQDAANWAAQNGFSAEQRALIESRGRPCHIQTYSSGHYRVDTFWYCDADGAYDEAFTFTNGHQTSHFVP